jgi:hypothetical protein
MARKTKWEKQLEKAQRKALANQRKGVVKEINRTPAGFTNHVPAYSIVHSYQELDPPAEGATTEREYAELIEVPELSEKVGFPCFLVTGDVEYVNKEEMTSNLCYIIAGNGTFLYKKNALFPSMTKVEGIGSLADLRDYCWYQDNKIPDVCVRQIVGFFKAVYEAHKSEAIILLYHNQKTLEWEVLVPEQTVSGASANYKMVTPDKVPEGFSRVGTWHSHSNMSAFFSGTDDHDDHRDDGLHLTLGDCGERHSYLKGEGFIPSIVASYASNKQRWSAEPWRVMEAPVKILEETATKTMTSGVVKEEIKTDEEYILRYGADDDLSFPKEWMDKVTHMSITTVSHGASSGSIVPFSHGGAYSGSEYGVWGGGRYVHPRALDIGCSECSSYATKTGFEALIELVELAKKDVTLLKNLKDMEDVLSYVNDAPTLLNKGYVDQLVSIKNYVAGKDKALASKLEVRSLLWAILMLKEEDYYAYFDAYADWWLVHEKRGPVYCLNPHSSANELQRRYSPTEFEPLDYNDTSIDSCDMFYPHGGFSWSYDSLNSRLEEYHQRHEAMYDAIPKEVPLYGDDITCYDCEYMHNTLNGMSVNVCERYIGLIDSLGAEEALILSAKDMEAETCDEFTENYVDVEEVERNTGTFMASSERLKELLDSGELDADDYAEAMLGLELEAYQEAMHGYGGD